MAAMSLRLRLGRLARLAAGAGDPPPPLEPRHERREHAREQYRADDDPLWPPEERHENPGPYEVQDVAPGTPGAGGSHRVIGGRD